MIKTVIMSLFLGFLSLIPGMASMNEFYVTLLDSRRLTVTPVALDTLSEEHITEIGGLAIDTQELKCRFGDGPGYALSWLIYLLPSSQVVGRYQKEYGKRLEKMDSDNKVNSHYLVRDQDNQFLGQIALAGYVGGTEIEAPLNLNPKTTLDLAWSFFADKIDITTQIALLDSVLDTVPETNGKTIVSALHSENKRDHDLLARLAFTRIEGEYTKLYDLKVKTIEVPTQYFHRCFISENKLTS